MFHLSSRARVLAFALLLVFAGLGMPSPAHAGPVKCVVIQSVARCVIIVVVPGSGGGGGGGGNDGDPVCTYTGQPISCTYGDAYWNQQKQCYISKTDPQPPADHWLWKGHYPDGAIWHCTPPTLAGNPLEYDFWSGSPPAGPETPPDPLELAIQATEAMNLRAAQIGSAPRDVPGSVGLIGLPQWMWLADPGPTTTGPISRTAADGSYSVTATARLTQTVWDMGDGNTVTCTGPGTRYTTGWGNVDSPTCGYRYTDDGRYNLTATGQWRVDWRGMGTSGAFLFDLPRSTTLTMGELQVLVQGG